MNKYNQELPVEVEAKLDACIERIKAIKWFQPSEFLDKTTVESWIHIALKAFGVEATIEYRKLETPADWGAAWDAAWGAARDAAWGAAWDAAWGAARDAAWDAALGAARDAAWGAAWDAAWGAADVLALNVDSYKEKYPEGNFINLIPLYEAGLYPVGVVDGKFIVYVPPSSTSFPTDLVT